MPSARSGDLFGNGKMSFNLRPKYAPATIGHFLSSEQGGRFDNVALAMHPVRLNPIEPRALAGRGAGHDAHALPLLEGLDLTG